MTSPEPSRPIHLVPPAPPAAPGPVPPAAPPVPHPVVLDPLVRAEQIRDLYRRMPVAFAGSALCATVLGVTLAPRITSAALAGWLLLAYGNSCLRGLLWYRFRQTRPSLPELPRWERRFIRTAGLAGLIWGTGGLLLHVPGSFPQQILVLLVMLGMTLTGLLLAGGSLTAFVAFVAPVLFLSAVPFLADGGSAATLIGLATLALMPFSFLLARRVARDVRRGIEIQLRHRRLLGQLRVQKRAAVEASQAKSRFLAMASHDLRQPLHALRLFVQALQERPLPGVHERELVANVRRSVDAMDELFDALLDISKLDAGAVRGRVVTFPLEELFERLRFEFAGPAQQKELRLTVPRTSVYVRSDPDLLAQILRNLLANAMRYTDRGGVLIGCRRELGEGGTTDRVRIEIWDTGCGIPPEKHATVFQEFTQLKNPEHDRRKGLGLGLAIVERLSRLLSHPVTLRSRVGRGSVFGVSLPRGRPQDHVRTVPANDLARGFDLSGIAVLLIDDEMTARETLVQLLTKWRCQVVAASSGAEALDRLGVLRGPPDVILVDYRLREQADAVMVLQRLQGELGPEVPALVVTASNAQERRECEASGVPVLGKPVNAARLRTLLAHIAKEAARAGARRAL